MMAPYHSAEDIQRCRALLSDRARLKATVIAAEAGDPKAAKDVYLVTEILNGREPTTTKSVTVTQKDDEVMKSDAPKGWRIERAADGSIRAYMQTVDGGWKEADTDAIMRLEAELNGRGTEQMFETMPSPSSAKFPGEHVPMAADGHPDSVRPETYGFDEPGMPGVRVGPNFVLANVDPNIAEPLNFNEPEPKDRHDADDADVNAFRGSPVFKSESAHGVKKGLFANLIKPEGTEGNRSTF